MSNLGLLLKTNIINEFGINKLKNSDKEDRKKLIGTMMLVIVGVSALLYYLFTMCFLFSDFLLETNSMELLLVIGFMGSVLFTLFTSLYKASSYLFEAKDYDMLISLPLKESTILASKIFMMIFSNYIMSLPFILIPGIVYFTKVDTSVFYFPLLIITFLVVPLIPIVLSSIVSFIIGNISSKLKYKNLVMIVGSIILLIAYMLLVMRMEEVINNIIANSTSIMNAIINIYPPAYYFVDTLKNNSITSLVIYLLLSIVPFTIFVYIFARSFKKINSRMNEKYRANSFKLGKLQTSSPLKALVKKEISRYFSSYIYVLNTSFGVIMLLVGTLGILIFGMDNINAMLELNIDMNLLKPQITLIIMFILATTCTTYCSISFEGKNLWILKSLPIDELDIFKAKISLNLLLNAPITIVSFILLAINLKFDTQFIIIMVCTIASMSILVAVAGLLINLHFPNFDWKNEVAVVKRSIGIMVVLFGSMIYVGMFALIYYYLKMPNINVFLLIFAIITILFDIVIWKITKSKGVKLFKAL